MGLFDKLRSKKTKQETSSEKYERAVEETYQQMQKDNADFKALSLEEKLEYMRKEREERIQKALEDSINYRGVETSSIRTPYDEQAQSASNEIEVSNGSKTFDEAMEALMKFNERQGTSSRKEITTAAEILDDPTLTGRSTTEKLYKKNINQLPETPASAAEILDGEDAVAKFMREMEELDKKYKNPGGFGL